MQIWSPIFNLLTQKFWGWGQTIYIFVDDPHLVLLECTPKFENHWTRSFLKYLQIKNMTWSYLWLYATLITGTQNYWGKISGTGPYAQCVFDSRSSILKTWGLSSGWEPTYCSQSPWVGQKEIPWMTSFRGWVLPVALKATGVEFCALRGTNRPYRDDTVSWISSALESLHRTSAGRNPM